MTSGYGTKLILMAKAQQYVYCTGNLGYKLFITHVGYP